MPPSPTKPPPAPGGRIGHYILVAFLDALLVWLVSQALHYYTLHNLAAGTTYVFAPRGLGLLRDAITQVLLITFFFVLATFPAFLVRRWLGCLLRALMFAIFGLFLTYLILTHVIAVVETPDHKVILYRPFPFRPLTLDHLPNARLRITPSMRMITFLDGTAAGIWVYPVYSGDTAGQAELDRLLQRVNIVETRR